MSVLIMTDILFKKSLVSYQIISKKVLLFCETEVRTMRCRTLRHVTVNWPVIYAYPEEIRYWNHRNKPY